MTSSIGFILLSATMIAILMIAFHKVLSSPPIDDKAPKNYISKALIGFTLWTVYVFLLCKSGFLAVFELPPRFPLLIVMPLFLFIGFFLSRHRNNPILHAIPQSWPVYIQTFRIAVESLFVLALAEGALPWQVTLEGYNMDILFGISAPIIAFLVFNKKVLSKKWALLWNYAGLAKLAFIIFLFSTTVYFPSVWGSETTLATPRLTEFGNMLVPGFLMPLAVFMHLLSIIQLSRERL